MRDSLPFNARQMPDGVHQQGRRDKLLRLPIGELSGWQLVAACSACRAERVTQVSDLVKRYGPDATLVMLVPRLRCRAPTCGRPPSLLVLRNRPPAATAGPRLMEVVLLGTR